MRGEAVVSLRPFPHGEDPRRLVLRGVEELVEPALVALLVAPALAEREDAGGVVARAAQQVVQAAGARLLLAAHLHVLRVARSVQQQGQEKTHRKPL